MYICNYTTATVGPWFTYDTMIHLRYEEYCVVPRCAGTWTRWCAVVWYTRPWRHWTTSDIRYHSQPSTNHITSHHITPHSQGMSCIEIYCDLLRPEKLTIHVWRGRQECYINAYMMQDTCIKCCSSASVRKWSKSDHLTCGTCSSCPAWNTG